MQFIRTARVVSPAICLAALGAVAFGPAVASADTVSPEQRQECRGASPNAFESYKVAIKASQMTEPVVGRDVTLLIQHSKTFLRPFNVTATLTWRNQATGAQGTIPMQATTERNQLFMPLVSELGSGTIQPGKGPVQFTLRAQPHGGKQVPATVCVANFRFL